VSQTYIREKQRFALIYAVNIKEPFNKTHAQSPAYKQGASALRTHITCLFSHLKQLRTSQWEKYSLLLSNQTRKD
jgi:hypothetical protein